MEQADAEGSRRGIVQSGNLRRLRSGNADNAERDAVLDGRTDSGTVPITRVDRRSNELTRPKQGGSIALSVSKACTDEASELTELERY